MPSSGLYVRAWGHTDDRRFARVFRQVWRKLPLSARRVMVRHWRQFRDAYASSGLRYNPDVPLIEVLDYKSDFHRGPSGAAAGQTGSRGSVLAFWAPWVGRLPDEHLETLIAHELAHVFLIVVEPGHMEQGPLLAESDVAELLTAWDFDEDLYHQWTSDNLADLVLLGQKEYANSRHRATAGRTRKGA